MLGLVDHALFEDAIGDDRARSVDVVDERVQRPGALREPCFELGSTAAASMTRGTGSIRKDRSPV